MPTPGSERKRSFSWPKYLTGVAFVLAGLLGCQLEADLQLPLERTLIVAVRPGPASWYAGAHGERAGFDFDLLSRYAASRGLALEVVEVDSAQELVAKVASGRAHMGMGGLYPPFASHVKADAAQPDPRPVLWTSGSLAVEPVLVYNRSEARPRSWRDVAAADVAYAPSTGIEAHLAPARAAAKPALSAEALIAQVSDGDLAFAVVPAVDALATRNVFVDCDVAFAVGPKREQAWAVAPSRRALRDDIDRFLQSARRDGLLARLAERYFEPAGAVARNDAAIFQERVQSLLPRYRPWFESAQARTGLEWRLIAAVAYQESQWDPSATSETGVRGFMQITEETASYLRIGDRLDPHASISGAARYLAELKAKLPARIAEPDRTWLSLAAFNIGAGHVEDARVLAQRQKLNPDLWADVRKVLPLLALPEHYELARNGYARGGMPVVFVDRVRAYYDILLRQLPELTPPPPSIFLVASLP
jgi:membrane-bound lytic murein transglycosylase F